MTRVWRRALALAALTAALVAGASEPAPAISGSAGTGVAVAAQHSEHGDGRSLDDGRIADVGRRLDRQQERQLGVAATSESDLPMSGWLALAGLVVGLVLLLGGRRRAEGQERVTDPA